MLLAGSLWEIPRFFLLISLLAFLLHAVSGTGRWLYPWLLLCGSGNLLAGAGGIMLALFPEKNGGLVGLLRLGKVLALFSYLLLLFSGAMRISVGLQVLSLGPVAVTLAVVLFIVFVLDLLFLAVLLGWRAAARQQELPAAAAHHDEYTETEAQD